MRQSVNGLFRQRFVDRPPPNDFGLSLVGNRRMRWATPVDRRSATVGLQTISVVRRSAVGWMDHSGESRPPGNSDESGECSSLVELTPLR